jgi:ribosomal protein S18 acetylase RimI-like enzyme
MAAAVGAARNAGAESLFLEVAADNVGAQAFYSAEGFFEVGRRPRYYRGEIDALVLRRDL